MVGEEAGDGAGRTVNASEQAEREEGDVGFCVVYLGGLLCFIGEAGCQES